MIVRNDHYALDHFEGTLDFLLCLIQKEEIDIYDVPIQNLIHQFIQKFASAEDGLDDGAEFIAAASYLVLLKSKTLLPSHEQEPLHFEETLEDPHFEIIHHLIDYCRFKQAAKELTSRQDKQQGCYFRGIDVPAWKKPLGIDHVSLEELSQLFKEMMEKASQAKPLIHEENWRVADKIRIIRRFLQETTTFPFVMLFSPDKTRPEIIVIFLAVLELMKTGELAVGKEQSSGKLVILAKSEESSL
jgi:segregation and condensation protein A